MAQSILDSSEQSDLAARIHALRPETQPRWGIMTVGQMVVHCTDQLRVSLGEKPITSIRIPAPVKPLMKWWFVSHLKRLRPGTKTLKELDSQAAMTRPVTFEADRSALLGYLTSDRYPFDGVEHPLFGHLTRRECGEIGWKHLDHHLRQFGV